MAGPRGKREGLVACCRQPNLEPVPGRGRLFRCASCRKTQKI